LAQKYGVRQFTSVDQLLDEVDAVSIATSTPTHFSLVSQCLDAGRDVFVEKPFTETTEQASALVKQIGKTSRIVQVGHIERFNPAYVEVKNVVETLTPLCINFRRLSSYLGSNNDVDVVLDLMIHDLDLALDIAGSEPTRIDAYGFTAYSSAIDHAVVNLQFEQWPLISLTASRVTEQKVRSIEVTALEAYVEGDLLNKSVAAHHRTFGEYVNVVSKDVTNKGVKYRQESVVERIHVPNAEPLQLELEHFVECVRFQNQPLVSAAQALRTLRLADQIRQAIYPNLLDARTAPGAISQTLPMPSLMALNVPEAA
jgi:predicted dehydrogenase